MLDLPAMLSLELPLSAIRFPKSNTNVMSEEQYALLVKAIGRVGFLQPVLVRPIGEGLYEVVDGVHRVKAATDLGIEIVPCVVKDASDADATAIQIGMNRMRGEVDLGRAATAVAGLVDEGWSFDQLTITGFSAEELDDLVRSVRASTEDILNGSAAGLPESGDEAAEPGTVFTLEVPFDCKADMQRAKRALRKLAGKGNALGIGLMHLIDGE